MDTIGYLILFGLGFFAVKLMGGSQPAAGPITGAVDTKTGALLIDSSQFSGSRPGFTGPVQGPPFIPATRLANGTYYCPMPTKLYKDQATGTYRCYNPADITAAAAAATPLTAPNSAITTNLSAPAPASVPYAATTGPSLAQLGQPLAPDQIASAAPLPAIDWSSLVDPSQPADPSLPQPAPIAGTDQILGDGSQNVDTTDFTASGALYT